MKPYLNPVSFEILNFSRIYIKSYLKYSSKSIRKYFESVEIINEIPHFIFNFKNFKAYFIYPNNKKIKKISEIPNIYNDLILHRELDKPAYISKNEKKWVKFGILFRENSYLPTSTVGTDSFFSFNNFKHRAKKMPSSTINEDFHIFGKLVSETDISCYETKLVNSFYINNIKHEEFSDNLGNNYTVCNKLLHREDDKPSFFNNFYQIWFKNGIPFRNFKPAFIYKNDNKIEETFFKNGKILADIQEIKKEIIAGKINSF